MSESTPAARRPKGRSPSYPAINLETAVDRVRVLWEKEQQHPTPPAVVVIDWGYKSLNGPAGLSLAALKKFGLTDDEGKGDARRVRVSDLAVKILAHPDPVVRQEAIQQAALAPTIHRDMWGKYGTRPFSDDHARWWLTQERGFTMTGADEFIPEYRQTISFAQLGLGGTVEPQVQQPSDEDGADEITTPAREPAGNLAAVYRDPATSRQEPGVTSIPVLLPGGDKVTIEGRFPISEADWNQMMAVLSAMKLGMVRDEAPGGAPPED